MEGVFGFSRDQWSSRTGKVAISEIDAATGVEEIEVVERRTYALQLSVRRYGRIASDKVNLGREVLVHRVEVHVRRVDRLIESERPARDQSAGDLGRDRHIAKGASCEKAIGGDLAHSATIAVARAADTVADLFIAAPEGGVSEGRQEAQLALDAQLDFPGIHERSARSSVEARLDSIRVILIGP